MKKTTLFLLAATAIAGTLSCNKNTVTPEVKQSESLANGAITVSIGAAEESKAAISSMKDFHINNVQIFVFDANNRLETDVYKDNLGVDNTTQVTINTKTGAKTVYALVNHSRLYRTVGSDGLLLTEFEATLADLGENDSETDLVMSGKNTVTVTDYNNNGSGGSPQPVSIFVKRLAACIQLDGVTVNFSNNSLKDATFTVKKLYLKNVMGKSPIGVQGLTATAETTVQPILLPDSQYAIEGNWYNKMKEEAGAPSVVTDVYSKDCTVAGVKTDLNRVLFAFPNATDGDSNDSSWKARHTRLVIQAHVTKSDVAINQDTYYVLDLPVLAANTIYKIDNINITMLGKDDDSSDEGIKVGKETYTITVDPWNPTITHLNYEF